MKAIGKQLGIIALSLSCAAAQNTVRTAVETVTATREGADLRIEITLSTPVTPSVETAQNPERILLDFPGTVCYPNTKNLSVHRNGVARVRTSQHSTDPLVTRLVVDLDQARQYSVKTDGNLVILTIATAENARRRDNGAPVAPAKESLIGGIFRRRTDRTIPPLDQNADATPLPAPSPTVGVPFEPPVQDSSEHISASSASNPPAGGSSGSSPASRAPSLSSAGLPAAQANPVAQGAPVAGSAMPAGQSSSRPAQAVGTSEPEASAGAALTPPAVNADKAARPAVASTVANNVSTATDSNPSAPLTPTPVEPTTSTAESTLIARSDDPSLRTVFRVKYVAEGVAYLEGGRAQGLAEGMKLVVEDTGLPAKQGDSASAADPRAVAELVVSAVAETSAVTDIQAPKRPVKPGDLAYLSTSDAEALVQQRALSATRQYPAVISFTESDELDEEARLEVPKPALPSVNRARGRFGFDDILTVSHGTSTVTSSDVGMVFRGDITRIGGTYWNLSGYWRGELTKASAASQQTLQNLLNRTYHLNITYDNPNSTLVAGFGRLYLPWAPSLDTIDGGYFGKRLNKGTTLGIFAGSTPDPSSWDYSPSNAIGGLFLNFEGGQYDGFRYSSTAGAGISMMNWAINRPFLFMEDSLSYKRTISIYESAQFDSPRGNTIAAAPGPGLGRNFFTLRVDPASHVELDANYNYFRDIPTFNTTLVGTGLLDKYLFSGFSGGGRLEVWKQVWLSANLGRSSGTGDSRNSLNEMYGISWGRIPFLNARADLHYARFNSSFGNGQYESLSVSRQMSERLRLELLLGQQKFASMITANTSGKFLTGTVETTLGPHYYMQGNFTTNRGDLSYDQGMFSVGYRFDTKRRGE